MKRSYLHANVTLKKRRGLHTIIGAVFFVLVMGTTIGYVTYSMDLLDDLAYQIDVKQDLNLNRQDEEFKVSDISIDNNEFNLTVTNTGTIPINITNMWAQNMTDSSWNHTKYQLNQVVTPGQSVANIGQGTGLIALNSSSYLLKMNTDRGNSLSTQLLSATSQPLEMSLFTTPANPLSAQNVTLLYTVKNNLTTGKIIQSLVPDFRPPVTTGTATAQQQGSPSPPRVDSLQPGETAFFETTYYVEGGNTETVTFNATIVNAVQGNYVTDKSVIDIAPVSESAINEVLGGQVGVISMNFTSFEACKPLGSGQQDCTSDSSDWERAWNLTKNTRYLYRMNVTNNGALPIIIEKATSLMQIPMSSGGSGSTAKPYYMRDDSTPTVENPGAYTDLTKSLPANPNATSVLYLGGKGVDDDAIASTDSNHGIVGVFLILFGYEDLDGDGNVDPGEPEYAQTLPFQAFRLNEG